MTEVRAMNKLFGFFTADGRIVFSKDDYDWRTHGFDWPLKKTLERKDFLDKHRDATDKMNALIAKYEKNHPDYDGFKAIGFFFIENGKPDTVMLYEDCAGNESVPDLLAPLRASFPRGVEIVEKGIAGGQ